MTISTRYNKEEEIIRGCTQNNSESQKQLYFMYADEMYTTAYRIMKEEHMASDVLHDAFLLIFKKIGNLRKPASLRAWIKSIVVNAALKTLQRHRKIHYTDQPLVPENHKSFDPMNGEQIEQAIQSLPEGYRVVFLLVEVEGYKHHEVAGMLNISEGTSKSQLFYAKKSLRKMLNEY